METLLYGWFTCSPITPDYDRLRKAHPQTLLRCLGWRKRKSETTSYAMPTLFSGQTPRALRRQQVDEGYCSRASLHAWEKSGCRRGRCLGTSYGGKATPGDRSGTGRNDLKENPKAFGIRFDGCREAAQKVGRWFRRVDLFAQKWHKDDNEATA